MANNDLGCARATSEAQLATARCPGFINSVKQEVK
jgi:hypothetical protein